MTPPWVLRFPWHPLTDSSLPAHQVPEVLQKPQLHESSGRRRLFPQNPPYKSVGLAHWRHAGREGQGVGPRLPQAVGPGPGLLGLSGFRLPRPQAPGSETPGSSKAHGHGSRQAVSLGPGLFSEFWDQRAWVPGPGLWPWVPDLGLRPWFQVPRSRPQNAI